MRINSTAFKLLTLCLLEFCLMATQTGCQRTLNTSNPNDSRINDPAHVRVKGPTLFTPFEYDSTKNVQGKAEYNADTKQFKVELNTDAATVNETLVKMQDKLVTMLKDYTEQVKLELEDRKAMYALLQVMSANSTQAIGMITNLPGSIVSALTGKPFTSTSPPALATAGSTLTIDDVRFAVAGELSKRPPALTEEQIANVVRRILKENSQRESEGE